jgi:hypothetical protein
LRMYNTDGNPARAGREIRLLCLFKCFRDFRSFLVMPVRFEPFPQSLVSITVLHLVQYEKHISSARNIEFGKRRKNLLHLVIAPQESLRLCDPEHPTLSLHVEIELSRAGWKVCWVQSWTCPTVAGGFASGIGKQ